MESVIIAEAKAALDVRLRALAEPSALAMRATGELLPQLDSSLVAVVLATRALNIGAIFFSPGADMSDMRKREEANLAELRGALASLANDLVLVSSELEAVKEGGREATRGGGRKISLIGQGVETSREGGRRMSLMGQGGESLPGCLAAVKETLCRLEAAHSAMVNRSHDLDEAMDFIRPQLTQILERYRDEVSVDKAMAMLDGLPYTEVSGPYTYVLYVRCLALQLSAVLHVSRADVVSLGRAFKSFNDDVLELRQWLREQEQQHYLKNGCRF